MYTTSAQLLTVHGFLRRHPPPREAPRRAELLTLRPTPSGLDGDFMSADVLWMLNEDARTAVGSSRYFFFLVFFFFCAFAKRAVCFGATGEWLLAVVLSIPFTVTPHNPLPVFFFSFFFFLLISDSARGTGEEMLWVFFSLISHISLPWFFLFFFSWLEIWIPLGWCWCEQLSPRWQTPEIKPAPRLSVRAIKG